MNTSLKKLSKLLRNYPDTVSSSENLSEIEVVNSILEARTSGAVKGKPTRLFQFLQSLQERFTGQCTLQPL